MRRKNLTLNKTCCEGFSVLLCCALPQVLSYYYSQVLHYWRLPSKVHVTILVLPMRKPELTEVPKWFSLVMTALLLSNPFGLQQKGFLVNEFKHRSRFAFLLTLL